MSRGCQVLPSRMLEQLSEQFQTNGHPTVAKHMYSGVVLILFANMQLQLAACSENSCSPCQSQTLWEGRLRSKMEWECANSSESML